MKSRIGSGPSWASSFAAMRRASSGEGRLLTYQRLSSNKRLFPDRSQP